MLQQLTEIENGQLVEREIDEKDLVLKKPLMAIKRMLLEEQAKKGFNGGVISVWVRR